MTEAISALHRRHLTGKGNSWIQSPWLVPKAPEKDQTHFSFQDWVCCELQIFFPALSNFPQAARAEILLSELTLWGCCSLMLNFTPEKQTEKSVLAAEVPRGSQGPVCGLLTVGAPQGRLLG